MYTTFYNRQILDWLAQNPNKEDDYQVVLDNSGAYLIYHKGTPIAKSDGDNLNWTKERWSKYFINFINYHDKLRLFLDIKLKNPVYDSLLMEGIFLSPFYTKTELRIRTIAKILHMAYGLLLAGILSEYLIDKSRDNGFISLSDKDNKTIAVYRYDTLYVFDPAEWLYFTEYFRQLLVPINDALSVLETPVDIWLPVEEYNLEDFDTDGDDHAIQ